MRSIPSQLTLDLAHRPALGAEDFFLSNNNALSVALIDSWPRWPQYGCVLTGPEASGKTHLVNVWRLRSGAELIAAGDLDLARLGTLDVARPLAIEDIDRGGGDEETLFHLLNRVREAGGQVLLTTRVEPGLLPIGLRDLRSRLLALPTVAIEPPDDDLLRAVLVKQFADRQIGVDPALVDYLLKRMERSMKALASIVDALDRGTLGTGRRITRPLARQILDEG